MRGTSTAFNMLLEGPDRPNDDTLYFISDYDSNNVKLYLGSKLIAGGSYEGTGENFGLNALIDVALSSELKDKQILTYDKNQKCWTNTSLENALEVFSGATKSSSGKSGLVPAPNLGETDLFLKSDGTWAKINTGEKTILTIENESSETMHQDIINEATQGILLSVGDIIIIKDIIVNNKWQYTSYIYNGTTWAAMDGNYNAENIYFDEDFIFTEKIGTVNIPSSGSAVVEASGKNLKEFLESLFSKEIEPQVTLPSISFTLPKETSLEVGSKISPFYSLNFNKGKYTYDNDTGVSVQSWKVSDGTNVKYEQSATMPEIQLKDNEVYSLTASAQYSNGIIPHSNLGNLVDNCRILASETKTINSQAISGYRNIFAGADVTNNELNSDFIRANLLFYGNSKNKKEIIWSAADYKGIKRYIVAIPKNNEKTLISAIIVSSMNADATADYVKQANTIKIAGENGYDPIEYNIWIYEPASIAETEIHKIIID